MDQTEVNKADLNKDQNTLNKIDSEVMTNKALAYTSRAMIEENRCLLYTSDAADE